MIRILFVCMGNICRSPVAQGVFEDVARREARLLDPEDCERFDYILTMDEANYRAVSSLCRGSATVRPFLDYATGSPAREVPDPYHGGPGGFEYALNLIEEASEGLLHEIRTRHPGV
jgi:protein-tyrosine phosphatase